MSSTLAIKLPVFGCLLLAAAAAAAPDDVKLGTNASLGGKRVFPADNVWNVDISQVPVDPKSSAYIASIGGGAPLHPDFGGTWQGQAVGIPYVVVAGDTPRVPVLFRYWPESDRVLYPIPRNPPIEGGDKSTGDRHLIVIDRDNWTLYELAKAVGTGGAWTADAGALWDMTRNHTRPEGWTSADAAGLPMFAGLVRYDEVVEQKEIRHALRFTAAKTRRAYVWPASHFASRETDASLPPMGIRVRLKAKHNIATYPPTAQVVLRALQKYGMILADNGGSWFLSGVADPRWSVSDLAALKRVKGDDFEVILTGNVVTP
jgi:hypothetical protein